MKTDKILYAKLFSLGTSYLNERIGIEIQIDEGDDIELALAYAKGVVSQFHVSSNPNLYPDGKFIDPENLPERQVDKQKTDIIVDDINSCKDLKTLETYKFIVRTNHDLQDAYHKKLKTFTND